MIGRTNVSGGGLNINGIIQEYVAGGNISAGKFVSYINSRSGSTTQLASTNYSSTAIAVALSDTKVVVFYQGASSGYVLNAVICTIEGNNITVGTSVVLYNYTYGGSYVSAVLLSNNRIFVTHTGNGDVSKLNAMICIIEGDNISVGTSVNLVNANNASVLNFAFKITDDKVCVLHKYGSDYLYAIICNINESIISIGTDTQISSNSYSAEYNISGFAWDSERFFVCHQGSSTYNRVYCSVCKVTNDTISVEKGNVQLSTTNYEGRKTYCLPIVSSSNLLKALVITYVNGTTYIYLLSYDSSNPSAGFQQNKTGFSTVTVAKIKGVYLDNNKYVFCLTDSNNYTISIVQFSVNENLSQVTKDYIILLDSIGSYTYDNCEICKINNNKILNLYGKTTDRILNSKISDLDMILPISEMTETILGVSETSNTIGQKTKVFIPEVN